MFAHRRRRPTSPPAGPAAHAQQLRHFLESARAFNGVDASDVPGMHTRLRADERVFICTRGARLFQRPGLPTSAQVLRPTPIDCGELVVTSIRAVFTGTKQIRQWIWADLAGVEHADDGPWTTIEVSSRSRTFGVMYDDDHRQEIRFAIELAVADTHGTRDRLIEHLARALQRLLDVAEQPAAESGATGLQDRSRQTVDSRSA